MNKITITLSLLFLYLLIGCENEKNKDNVIVSVDGYQFTYADLENKLSADLSKEDSINLSEYLIQTWVNDVLLYNIAQSNIIDNEKIEREVDAFRKQLILSEYESYIINEKISDKFTEDELISFYDENKRFFVLDETIIRGIFLKIPKDAPKLKEMKKEFRSFNDDNIETIEKYALQYAIIYDYFPETWINLESVLSKIPIETDKAEKFLKENKYIDYNDSEYVYFVNITGIYRKGEIQPYEYALPRVKELLIYRKRKEFIQNFTTELLDDALKKGRVVYYSNKVDEKNN